MSDEARNDHIIIEYIVRDFRDYAYNERLEKDRNTLTINEITVFLHKILNYFEEIYEKDLAIRNPEYYKERLERRKEIELE